MKTDTAGEPQETQAVAPHRGPLRRWFPAIWVGLLTAICFGIYSTDIDPGYRNTAIFAAVILAALGISAWGSFFSRLPSAQRWCVIIVPLLCLLSWSQLGPIQLILDGDIGLVGWRWRWAEEPDEMLTLSDRSEKIDQWLPTANDYPRFLGNGPWAEVSHVELDTDWQANPPKKLWQHKIGAGWSAFSIVGNYAVTQEQRGQQELVTCYELLTGNAVWTHADPVRWDPIGPGALGYAGPRATPTIHNGRIYAQGATGILNCLEARTGELIWSQDTLKKHQATNVTWGKSGSPLIVDDMVVISVGGQDDQSLVAYNIDTGKVVWASGKYQSSYASPVLAEFVGVRQVLSVDQGYVTARRADNGEPLWEYEWPSDSGGDGAVSQPVPLSEDRIFFSKGYGHGSALVQISHTPQDGWQAKPAWKGVRKYGQKPVMKTKMGNILVHDGFVYGLDDIYLQCIELATGKKQWKKRRTPKIGHGQIMLIGNTILILSEEGELILAEASPQKYHELASIRVFDDHQITWNNPAFAPPYLLVRNAETVACYELPLKANPSQTITSED